MKKILFFSTLMMLSMVLFAFTPTIDGVKDTGWGTTPTHSTTTLKQPIEFNLDGGCYVTDDANYVYIGIPTDNDPWSDGKPVHFHVAIDLRNTVTGGSSDAWGSQMSYGQPYKPEFDIISQWSTTSELVGWTGLQTWTGSAWSGSEFPGTNIKGGGGAFTEIAIPRSVLGNIEISEVINISVWARPAYDKPRGTVCLPADTSFPADWGDGGTSTFTTQFPYILTTLLADAIPPQVVNATQLTDSSFNLTFNEPMKEENATDTSNYTFGGGMTISSIDVVSSTVFTFHTVLKLSGGTTYSVIAHPEIVDIAGNPINATNDSTSFVGLYYSNVTFQVNMNVLIISGGFVPATDNVAVRGSFNGWGTTSLSDTDTDGIYTLSLSVPYGTGSSFSYKYWNNHLSGDIWESVSPDRSFTIAGVDNIIPVVYWNNTEPTGLTTHYIDVTFQVNMALQTVSADVYAAGAFNSWSGTATPMALDSLAIYSVTHRFPAYSLKSQEYKFVNDTVWEYIDNRTFTLNDSLSSMILPVVYFNNSIPTELSGIAFLQKASSSFTNFNNDDILPAGDSLKFEVRMTPVDIAANSQYSATLRYRILPWVDFLYKTFTYNNTYGSDSYWQTTLDNGIEVSDGDTIEFYVTATDYNGPIFTDDNSGAFYRVIIGGGSLPSPDSLLISLSGEDIHITWGAVTGASSYRVYYFNDPSNPSYQNFSDVTDAEITLSGHALFGSEFYCVEARP